MESCVNVMWLCGFVLLVGLGTATANSEGNIYDYPVGSSQSVYIEEYPNCSSSEADKNLDQCADFLQDLLHCGNAAILLTDSSQILPVQAPPGADENQCVDSLSCAWFITSDPGTSIYVQVHAQGGSHSLYSYSVYDEVVIGRGHDPFNVSSVVAEVELYYKRRLDDGRVYIVDSNLAWVRIFAHSKGYPDCVWFEMSFTQREKPGICGEGTTLCSYSSVCLPAEAYCDTFIDCGDFSDQIDCKMCGDTNISLVPDTPIVLRYGLPGYAPGYPSDSIWNPPKMDCFWLVSAPNDTVIEINILALNLIGPDVHIGSAVEGANDKSQRLFDIRTPVREPGIMYTAVSSLWIHSDITSAEYHRGTVFEIKMTTYRKEECDPGEFQCYNQECLPGSALCDGIPDCFVKEDEFGCDNCSHYNFYKCPDEARCIHPDWICDGFAHCKGWEDEFGCGRCGDSYINLNPGQTVEINQPVDITVDCLWLVSTSSNGSSRIRIDIQELPIREYDHYQSGYQIAELSFGSGHVVSEDTYLHTLRDSASYPDLLTLDGPDLWITLEMRKLNFNTGGRPHVKFTMQVYNVKDCQDEDDFSCSSGLSCVSEDNVCDGTSDCRESEDEVGCGVCNESDFRCSNGDYCVRALYICDGDNDCGDHSDERFCGPWGDNVIDLSSGSHRLKSIGYGHPPFVYPVNTYREWVIRAAPGYNVVVVFMDFATEFFYDFLSIRSVLPAFTLNVSGERSPTRVSTFSQEMSVFFLSDFAKVDRGFHLFLEQAESVSCGDGEVECNGTVALICILAQQVCDNRGNCPGATDEEFCSDICGETFIQLVTDEQHKLYSPLYHHGTYPFRTSCLWIVTTIRQQNIILAVKNFHLEQGYDDLRIGVGNDSNYGLVKRITGTTKVASIVFRSSTIWMQMTTDESVSKQGFEITLSSVVKMNDSDCQGGESHVFSCPNRHDTTLCLYANAYCDGFVDCKDKSDEIKCENLSCGELYMCKSKDKCLLWESVCDGTPDCEPFQDDETKCDVRGCPPNCNCSVIDNGDLHVTCKNGWSPSTIGQLVKRTSALDLGGGNVTVLTGGLFKRLVLLHTLSLRNNGIMRLELNAFEGLTDLTSLDISENNISELIDGVFNGLTMLTELGMRYVPIRHIRRGAFKGLSRLERLVLMRSDGTQNPTNYDEPAAKIETGALADLKSLQVVYVDDHRLCCDFEAVLNQSNNCVNIQLQSPLFNCGRLMQNIVLQVFMWILGLSALIGNAVVIVWRIREDSGKGSKYVHSFLVLNLAMSDFLMGVYMIIIASVDAIKKEHYYLEATQWRDSALCKAAGVISVLSSEASVFFITLISLDRYMCIVHPFSRVRLREKSVWLSALGIWICTLILSLIPTIFSTSDSYIYGLSDVCIGLPLLTRPEGYTFKQEGFGDALSNNTYLIPVPQGSKPSWSYSIVLFLGVNLLCFLAVTLCYIAIFAKVKRSVRRVKRSHKENEIKLASKMAIIVGSDFLCWMPVIVLGILSQTSVIKIEPEVYAWLVVFVLPINSSLNPYLYTIVTVVSRRNQSVQSTVKMPKKSKADTGHKVLDNPDEDDQGCWTTSTSKSFNLQDLTNKI